MKLHEVPHRYFLRSVMTGLLLFCGYGCSGEAPEEKILVYVDSENQEIFMGPSLKTPFVNPHTGRQTVQNGLYCGNCQTWHAVAPLEITGGNQVPVKCAETNLKLVADGPLPENATHFKLNEGQPVFQE